MSLSVKASLVVVASARLVTNRQQRLVSRKSSKKKEEDFPIPPVKLNTRVDPPSGQDLFHPCLPSQGWVGKGLVGSESTEAFPESTGALAKRVVGCPKLSVRSLRRKMEKSMK